MTCKREFTMGARDREARNGDPMKRVRGVSARIVAGVLLLLLIAGLSAAPALAGANTPVLAPLNPAFLQAMRNKSEGKRQTQLVDGIGRQISGYIPSPLQDPLQSDAAGQPDAGATALSPPASYDLRALGRVTPVRDQGEHGTCWAFASYGSLESALMPGENRDFSEDNLVNGTGYVGIGYDTGGWFEVALAYLARWGGPVDEASDPYPTPGSQNLPAVKHLQTALRYPPRRSALDNDVIKSAVMTNGGVGVTMRFDGAYYYSGTSAYYYNGTSGLNHAVVVVGWDDAFSRTAFGGAAGAPAGDGAFIVRNSWGSGWGDNGYFYVSYYDTVFAETSSWAFAAPEAATNYADAYQYDPLGWTSSLGYSSDTAWFANGYTARANTSVPAVAFYAATADASYQVYGGSSLTTLQQLSTGTFTDAGYHTVTLANPLSISSGARFYVAVRLTTPGYSYPVPLETPITGYAESTASAGQSYISSSGSSWSDLTTSYANTNVCLKAFAGDAGDATGPTLTVTTPNGGESWPVSSSQVIRWTSTGLSTTSRVKIALSRDGGATWSTLVSSTPNDGSQAWTVSGATSTSARIRITSTSQTAATDTSDADFTLGVPSLPAGR